MAGKRLAILGSRGIPARYGGFETFAEELSTRLVSAGVDVTVFCEKTQADGADEYRGVKLEYVRVAGLGPLTTILFDLRCLLLARKGYDIVYMLGYGASPFCFLPRLWGSQVWINMDGVEWARSKWSGLAKFWFRLCEASALYTATRILADAEAIKTHIASRHRRTGTYSVIPYGAEIVSSDPESRPLDAFDLRPYEYYLIVCRLEPENHVLEIVQGFLSSDSEVPLVIVGNHEVSSKYVESLLEYECDRILFVGPVFDKVTLRALRFYCRGYFHGHSVGGTNPSLLEALGAGNPVFAHDNVFNREVAGVFGRYFSDIADIPILVADFEADFVPGAARQRAWEIVRSRYTWEIVTRKYLALLETS